MDGAEIDITYGRARVDVNADPSGAFSAPVLDELKRAVVMTCIAMDTDEARKLASRIEGTPT